MYLAKTKSPRKTNRTRSNRLRAQLKRKNKNRQARMGMAGR